MKSTIRITSNQHQNVYWMDIKMTTYRLKTIKYQSREILNIEIMKRIVKVTLNQSLGNKEPNTGVMICIKEITLKMLLFTICRNHTKGLIFLIRNIREKSHQIL